MTPPADRLTVDAVADRLGVSEKSVRRWMRAGLSVGGRVVRLASLKIGHSRVTSESWLEAFLAAQNPRTDSAPVRSPAEARRASRKARRELAAIIGR
jgi:hypothetical protein